MTALNLPARDQLRSQSKALVDDADSLLAAVERERREPTAVEDARLKSIFQRVHALNSKASDTAQPEYPQRTRLFRAIHALTLAGGNATVAEMAARRANDPEVGLIIKATTAAGTTGAPAWAGVLVAPALGEFIGLLRPKSALFTLAPDPIPLTTGTINYPRATGAGTASGFVQEGSAIPVRGSALETVSLTLCKAAGIVVATGELVRRADRFAESFVLGTLSSDIALGVDQVFLSNAAATAAAPAGILHSSNAAAPIAATAGGSAAAAATDIAALLAAGANMVAPRLLINPGALAAAAALTDSSGHVIIQALGTGTIGRVQVITTGNITVDTIVLIDEDGLLVAGDGFELTVSQHAALHMSDTPAADLGASDPTPVRSMFQVDGVATRVLLPITWRSKRTEQVQWIQNATWA